MLTGLHAFLCKLADLLRYMIAYFRGHRPGPRDCAPCPPALKKPDPFLYSQAWLMSLGQSASPRCPRRSPENRSDALFAIFSGYRVPLGMLTS